jgi:hypothetical protein
MGPPSAVRSLPYGCGVRAEPAAATDTGTAVLEEYQALARSIAEQRERAERLRALANHATAQANEQEHALGDLGEVLGIDPQLFLDDLDVRLGGQRLQEIAVRAPVLRIRSGTRGGDKRGERRGASL